MSQSQPAAAPASAASHNARRRGVLRAAGAAAIAAPALILGRQAWSAPRKLTFAWNQNSFCLTPVVVAQERGFFEKNGLQVELINYSGSTDQLLESIATGKADAAIGMIHRWLKPLEAGFDVKIIGSSHGGCVRLVGAKAAGVTSLQQLKGKTVGVSDLAAPGKHFFTILLARHGIDPDKDITWRQYPADLLGVADTLVQCGTDALPLPLAQWRGGQRVRVVAFNGDPASLPMLDPRFQTLLLTRNGTLPPGVPRFRTNCVAVSAQAWAVYAQIAGVPASRLGGTELLADRGGWLRARGAPGTRGWSDADMVCRSGAPAAAPREAPRADGLTALPLRMDAEPVRFVKGGLVH